MQSIKTTLPLLLMLLAPPLSALQMYRTPVAPQPLPVDQAMGCPELEHEISSLLPLTYSYKPGFYQDPYQGGAIFLGTVVHPGFFAPLLVSGLVQYQENSRVMPVEDRIELLRRLKAEKHCYEG